jgi:hypothetical protein
MQYFSFDFLVWKISSFIFPNHIDCLFKYGSKTDLGDKNSSKTSLFYCHHKSYRETQNYESKFRGDLSSGDIDITV